MFEKTQVTEIDRAILAGLNAPCLTREENATDESLEELSALLDTAGGTCLAAVLQNKSADPGTSWAQGQGGGDPGLVQRWGPDIGDHRQPPVPSQQRGFFFGGLTEELGGDGDGRSA